MSNFYVVIPAGGSGTRLWPLSRASAPKFLHSFGSTDRSLIQATVDRLLPLAPIERTYIVCGAAHAEPIAAQLPALPTDQILIEPGPRNSAPAIGLAAAIIAATDPEAIMGSFAADHLIAKQEAFLTAVRTAIAVAQTGKLVTIGISPTRPETGYGYIRSGERLGIGVARAVKSFKEKPALDVATEYLESGQYLWNAGMFVWRAADLLTQLDQRVPELAAPLRRVGSLWLEDPHAAKGLLTELWPSLPSISIDHAVMEGAAADGAVATVPADLGWSDVGDWKTVADLASTAEDPAHLLLIDSPGTSATSTTGRSITVVGVPDVVIVETGDAILVVARERAQDVKEAVEGWRAKSRQDLL